MSIPPMMESLFGSTPDSLMGGVVPPSGSVPPSAHSDTNNNLNGSLSRAMVTHQTFKDELKGGMSPNGHNRTSPHSQASSGGGGMGGAGQPHGGSPSGHNAMPSPTQATIPYLNQLVKDKGALKNFPGVFIHVERLLEDEISRVRATLFQIYGKDKEPLELPSPEGEVKTFTEKIYVPVKDHPEYNFVGRILGPRGLTAKQLETETHCKIMVRGRGSMRDKRKEDANRGKPNWEHLSDELHVLISCEDTANRAQMKLKRAIEEVEKLLVPVTEGEDELKKKQLMELAILNGTYRDSSSRKIDEQLRSISSFAGTPVTLARSLQQPQHLNAVHLSQFLAQQNVSANHAVAQSQAHLIHLAGMPTNQTALGRQGSLVTSSLSNGAQYPGMNNSAAAAAAAMSQALGHHHPISQEDFLSQLYATGHPQSHPHSHPHHQNPYAYASQTTGMSSPLGFAAQDYAAMAMSPIAGDSASSTALALAAQAAAVAAASGKQLNRRTLTTNLRDHPYQRPTAT